MDKSKNVIQKKIIYWESFEPVNNMGKWLRQSQLDELRKQLQAMKLQLIQSLALTSFFEDYPFLEKEALDAAIDKRLDEKIEARLPPFITDLEFFELCDMISKKQHQKTLVEMFLNGALNLSINEDGQFSYSANKYYKVNNL